jgi:phosphatidylserine/phosphatidylglycerophosphate/cardiolipin synthase-like enzyme
LLEKVQESTGKYIIKRLFNAKRQALICSPYVSKHYADAIVKMVGKGINVKLITTNEKTGNFHAHEYFMRYAIPKSGQKASLEITIVDSSFIHAKMYLSDDEFAAFGSANLTIAGMWENVENIVTYDGIEVSNISKGLRKFGSIMVKGLPMGKKEDIRPSAQRHHNHFYCFS